VLTPITKAVSARSGRTIDKVVRLHPLSQQTGFSMFAENNQLRVVSSGSAAQHRGLNWPVG